MSRPRLELNPASNLDELERDVLTVAALVGRPLSAREWTQAAKVAGIRRQGRVLDAEALFCISDTRSQDGLIELRSEGEVVLDADVAMDLVADASERGVLERLATGADSVDAWSRAGFCPRRGRVLRVAVAEGASSTANAVIEDALRASYEGARELGVWLVKVLGHRPHARWLDAIGEKHRARYLREAARSGWRRLRPLGEATVARCAEASDRTTKLELVRYLALRGDGEAALKMEGLSAEGRAAAALLVAFWEGRYVDAYEIGEAAVAGLTRNYKQLRELEGLAHTLARIVASGPRPGAWEGLRARIEEARSAKAGFREAYGMLSIFCALVEQPEERRDGRSFHLRTRPDWASALVFAATELWLEEPSRDCKALELCESFGERARVGGFVPVAAEFEQLQRALELGSQSVERLAGSFRPRDSWELALDSLGVIAEEVSLSPGADSARSGRRIVWELHLFEESGWVDIQPRIIESERSKTGRKVTVARLLNGRNSGLREEDLRVLDFANEPSFGRSDGQAGAVLRESALPALIGHPRVIDPDGQSLTVVRAEPGLELETRDDRLVLRIDPPELGKADIAFRCHGQTIQVFETTDVLGRVIEAMGPGELEVPREGRARLTEALAKLGASVPVRSLVGGSDESERREAADTLVALLVWDGSVLDVRIRAAPLGMEGPKVVPGRGSAELLAQIDGRLCVTERALDSERSRMLALRDRCPTFAGAERSEAHARVPGLWDALELLLELGELEPAVEMAWPEGRALSVPAPRGLESLTARVKQGLKWLHVDLGVQVDAERVLSFRQLLQWREQGGRFIRLGEDQFVALTDQLRRRLAALEGLGPLRKGELEISPAALPLLDELCEGTRATFDVATRKRLDALRELQERPVEMPRVFWGTLRDYQHEGFVWMARLARMSLGACLADDMGLGKTVQALAMLCLRADEGPALVVVPTSVMHNWQSEFRRFAPTLEVTILADTERKAAIAGVGRGKVLVCSYGLLVRYAKELGEVEFATVVFDEAHALKNAQTQRAKAATRLRAGFRMSLTGTPVENHLGELWSVMNVTVPGLLSTERHFEERFASPIRMGDAEAARRLRALVRPFMLRRTKPQVLDELPPREEITLRVTPTMDERAFYQALRSRAIERLESVEREGGRARVQALAEIMRLRQSAVDPRLVDPESGPEGSKIRALVKRVVELREEGHRALVFSQFLGSLQAVRERLEQAGLEVLSLDGSTPARQRARRVDAFQAGEADVFVMSLKAGGVGVNLTAADYVLHLDPWWNPSVEDQATGRAHRIGQSRPVTVYRFITQGTIEEKILELHDRKRDLVEGLLDGLETAKKLDLDELKALLEE